MVDLGKTQAQWDAFFKILGAEIQVQNAIKSYWARNQKLRSGAVIQFDEQVIFSSIDLAGQAEIGVNTDVGGILYGKYNSVGPVTELYSDSARTALVASNTTPLGATTTLTEQNSSGFTGVQVTVGTGPFVTDNDWQIEVSQDFKKLLSDVYSNVGDESEDAAETASKTSLKEDIADAIAGIYETRRDAFRDDVLLTFMADFLEITSEDREEGAGFVYEYNDTAVLGQRTISSRLGVLAKLRQAMIDQSAPAGAQSVLGGTPSAGNFVPESGNQGSLKGENTAASSAISLILSQHVRSGTLRIRCIDETVGQARFSVQNVLDEPSIVIPESDNQENTTELLASGDAQVDKQIQDGDLGVDFMLEHITPVESGDDGNILSSTTIDNPNGDETDFGTLYVSITRTAVDPPDPSDEFLLELWSDASLTTLVGSQTITGIVGTTAIDITTNGGMVFQSTFNNANADTQLPAVDDVDDDIEFDIDPPQLGDEWTVALTEDLASAFNKYLAENNVGSLPTSGTPTIDDSYAKFTPTLEG